MGGEGNGNGGGGGGDGSWSDGVEEKTAESWRVRFRVLRHRLLAIVCHREPSGDLGFRDTIVSGHPGVFRFPSFFLFFFVSFSSRFILRHLFFK